MSASGSGGNGGNGGWDAAWRAGWKDGIVALGIGATTVLSLGGCDTEAFCFDCGNSDDGGGSSVSSNTGDGGSDAGVTVSTSSQGVSVGQDCPADTLTDVENCGFCGNVCALPNAFPVCEGGFCQVDECAPGWTDRDNLPTNGCEYQCAPSANGTEICDDRDNDCNGEVDETFDLTNDALNCGACNVVCTYGNAEGVCEDSECSRGDCFVGFHDVDADPDDCEYACVETAGGNEVCDLADNDCDGEVDEGIDTSIDEANCGTCGFDCSTLYPNTVPSCLDSICDFGDCLPDYYDIDGNQLNGCEYLCDPDVAGAEVCDGDDNDCNGFVDDGALPSVGSPCGTSEVGECAFGLFVCRQGSLDCDGAIEPSAEYCDGLDNSCNTTTDEGCPAANPTDTRLDLGSAVQAAVSTQLHVASRGDTVIAAYLDRRSGNSDIRSSATIDGGVTWPAATDAGVATGAANQVEPFVAISANSGYISFGQFAGDTRQVRVASASSPFTTWSASIRADDRPAATDSFYTRLAVARSGASGAQDEIVVVWQALAGQGIDVTSDIYLQYSDDGGATWLVDDLVVNEVAGSAELPVIATDGDGHVHIAWRDGRNDAAEVFADVFDVDAGTLSGNQPLSDGEAAEQITITAEQGSDRVYVAWTDLRATKKTIRLNRSSDDGETWAVDGEVVNRDSIFADSTNADIAARTSGVVVAWEDTRSGQPDIYVNRSTNGGATFSATSARVDLGDLGGASGSFTPKIAFGTASTVYVAWRDRRDGAGDIYDNFSFDGGVSFQPIDLRLDVGNAAAASPLGGAESRAPFLAATDSGDRAVVVWIDNRTEAGATGVNGDIYTNNTAAP